MTSIVSWLVGAAPQANNPLDDKFYDVPGVLSRAGVRVSPDSAMKISAVYRCVSILANVLAMFPKGMFEKVPRGRKEAPDHPLDPIISFAPNRRQTAFEFWRLLCFHLVLRQNAYAQIVPGQPGRGWVGQLVPLHPDRIRGPEELADGRLRYEYTRADGRKVNLIGGIDIWHLTGLSADGLKGLSMIDLAADTFGSTLSAERHAGRFFERGAKFAGILQHDKELKPEVAEAMSESFGRKYGGEAGAGKIPVLWEGMKFEPVSMSLKDAEFLDTRKFSVAEIARWFGVPPHMVGDVERSTSWGTGIEQQGLHFLIYSLLPWIELLEQSIKFTLVVQPEKFYPKFNVGALLRMDQSTQATVLTTYIEKGVYSPNDARELLDMNPREGGDEYVDVAKPPAPPQQPQLVQPPDEEEEEGDEEDVAASATVMKAGLLLEEHEALGKMAKMHAKDSDAWRDAVKTFYGRFARKIAASGFFTLLEARAWCSERRNLVLADGGLLKVTTSDALKASNVALLGGLHAEG